MKKYLLPAAAMLGIAARLFAQAPTPYFEELRLSKLNASTYLLEWWAKAGHTYFIQGSIDLQAAAPGGWHFLNEIPLPLIDPNPDAKALRSYAFVALNAWTFEPFDKKFFFRLRFTDQVGTDRYAADFDNDDLSNGWELRYDFDPLVGNATGDPDSDGASNLVEATRGSNPRLNTTADPDMLHVQVQVFTPAEP